MLATWNQFIDTLAGGKSNSAALAASADKPWFVRYSNTTIFTIGISIFIAYIQYVSFFLNPVPQYKDLKQVNATVLDVHFTDQQFTVQFPNRSTASMEWPGSIHITRGGSTNGPMTTDQLRLLKECDIQVRGKPIKGVLSDRFRIWELDCPSKRIRVDYETIKRDFLISKKSSFQANLILLPWFCLIFFILFIREKRGLPVSPGLTKFLSKR